jgi:hypothetical protein
MLIVEQCVPFLAPFGRAAVRLRAAYIGSPSEALSLPWIKGLPGEKRVRFFRGQIFVVQHYQGCKLIRAHISHTRELPCETEKIGALGKCVIRVPDSLRWDRLDQDTCLTADPKFGGGR